MDQQEVPKKTQPTYVIAAGVLIGIITIAFLISGSDEPEVEKQIIQTPTPKPEPVVVQSVEPEPEPEPEPVVIDEPVVEEPIVTVEPEPVPAPKPHPDLHESDDWLKGQLFELVLDLSSTELIADSDLISNFVVFVDNAAKGDLTTTFSPLKEPMSSFKAVEQVNNSEREVEYLMDPEGYRRYDGYVSLISSLSGAQSKALFDKVSPLIAEAYQQLGYEDDDFNDKLLDAIDLMLEAPVVEGDIALVTPSAMFQFADPELENLQPIQKLLLRMGPQNQRKVQEALRKFKAHF